MTNKIISISNRSVVPTKPEPDQKVIEMIEKLLHAAKEGTVQAVFMVGWNVDNSISSGWWGADRAAFTLLGGIEEAKHEYILRQFERRK